MPTRNSASTGVDSESSPTGMPPGALGLGAEPAGHLGDQRAEPVGEHRDLLFLAGDGKHPPAVDDLQEEFAFAGLPDGSGEEPVG